MKMLAKIEELESEVKELKNEKENKIMSEAEYHAFVDTILSPEYYPEYTIEKVDNLKESLMTTRMEIKIGNGIGIENNFTVVLYRMDTSKRIMYRKV